MKNHFSVLSFKRIVSSTPFLFTLILLFAGVFRLIDMQYVEFKSDEALNLFLATRPLFGHAFPPASLASSAGILNFPLLNYLLFPIVLFTKYPPAISFVIGLLNTITIGLFFLLFAKNHDKVTAFFASLTLALSPWAILYSRKIWAQDFLMPLLLFFFFALYGVLKNKKPVFWLLFGLSSTLLTQIHQIAAILPLFFFIYFLTKRRSVNWKFLFAGIVVGLIPTIPYFLYMSQIFCLRCTNTSLAARFSLPDLITLLRPFQIISLGDFHTELGDDYALFAQRFHLIYEFSKANYIIYLFLPLGALFLWIKREYRILLIALVVIEFILYIIGIQPLMHYFIVLLPFLALCTGVFFSRLFESRKFGLVALVCVVLYFGSLFAFDSAFFTFLGEKHGFSGDYGGSFASTYVDAVKTLKVYKNNPNYPEMLITYMTSDDWLAGYTPDGKMIYPENILKPQITSLEGKFESDPHNPIIEKEVMAYLTKDESPSFDYVLSVRKLSQRDGAYSPFYQSILDRYLSSHYKRLYISRDFLMLYPEHWTVTENKSNPIAVFSEPHLNFTIVRLDAQNDAYQQINKNASTILCANGNICNMSSGIVSLDGYRYIFSLVPVEKNSLSREENQTIFSEVISSLRSN